MFSDYSVNHSNGLGYNSVIEANSFPNWETSPRSTWPPCGPKMCECHQHHCLTPLSLSLPSDCSSESSLLLDKLYSRMPSSSSSSLPCEQRLHFRCMSCPVKSSLCRQPFNSILKSGQINLKNRFFPVLDRFRALRGSCIADQLELSQVFLFLWSSRHLTTDLTINFACESHYEFCACMMANWTVVGKGYFSQDSSHSENVASARRVLHLPLPLFHLPWRGRVHLA